MCRAQKMLHLGVRTAAPPPPGLRPRLETGGLADLLYPSKAGLEVCRLVSTWPAHFIHYRNVSFLDIGT